MEITFWGVRGSIPAPGPETARYGGNTLCVAVRTTAGRVVILEAGTGLVVLGNQLLRTEFGKGQGEAAIMLSHAHMDHIQGFPFFAPIFIPGNRFVIHGWELAPGRLEQIFEGQMNPNFNPVQSLRNLGAAIEFHAMEPDKTVEISGLKVTAHINPHGSTTALAFRLQDGDRSLVLASDVGYPEGGVPTDAVAFYKGADVLVHDCTYSVEDQEHRRNRGFSSIGEAAVAAVRAKVKTLVMIHYDQDYADEDVDRLKAACRALLDSRGGKKIKLVAAAEGLTLQV